MTCTLPNIISKQENKDESQRVTLSTIIISLFLFFSFQEKDEEKLERKLQKVTFCYSSKHLYQNKKKYMYAFLIKQITMKQITLNV